MLSLGILTIYPVIVIFVYFDQDAVRGGCDGGLPRLLLYEDLIAERHAFHHDCLFYKPFLTLEFFQLYQLL